MASTMMSQRSLQQLECAVRTIGKVARPVIVEMLVNLIVFYNGFAIANGLTISILAIAGYCWMETVNRCY